MRDILFPRLSQRRKLMSITECMRAGFTNRLNEQPFLLLGSLAATTTIVFLAIRAFNGRTFAINHNRNYIAERETALLQTQDSAKVTKLRQEIDSAKRINRNFARDRILSITFAMGIPTVLFSRFLYSAVCSNGLSSNA